MEKVVLVISIISGILTFFSFSVTIAASGEIDPVTFEPQETQPGILFIVSGIIFICSLIYLI